MLTINEWMKKNKFSITDGLAVSVGDLVIPRALWDSVKVDAGSDIVVTHD